MTTAMDRDGAGQQQQRQCRRDGSADVELHAAMALADMAGVEHAALPPQQHHHHHAAAVPPQTAAEHEDEELASTRLSLELGNVGIHSSPCSSSSSGAGQQPPHAPSTSVTGYGPSRPRNTLTEAEKEAKRLRRVLANRESARQTILRRQAIRDELARKVADLASQNENMKKEKDMVLEQYLSLKETNKQLKQQYLQVSKTTKKKPSSTPATSTPMDITPSTQQHAEASPPPTPPQPSFLYSGPPPTMPPVPYVWGSWPPCGPGAYEHSAAGHAPPPLCLPPACAWYYPVVTAADPRGSPPSYVQPFQELAGSPGSGGTGAGECTDDDDPCSLTLAIDAADKKSTVAAVANAHQSSSVVVGAVGLQVALSSRDKAATAAEARKRRKELTKLKHMHAGSRHGAGSDHW